MRKTYLEAGKLRGVHGLKGEVKAENWLDNDRLFASLTRFFTDEKGENELRVRSRRRQGDLFLLAFEGIEDADAAAPLRNKTLYARRDEIDPEGKKVFYTELLGLDLIDADSGKIVGAIRDVEDRGGGFLYVIALPDGKEAYFPAVKEWITEFDLEKGVTAHIPKGLFDG